MKKLQSMVIAASLVCGFAGNEMRAVDVPADIVYGVGAGVLARFVSYAAHTNGGVSKKSSFLLGAVTALTGTTFAQNRKKALFAGLVSYAGTLYLIPAKDDAQIREEKETQRLASFIQARKLAGHAGMVLQPIR